MAIIHRSKIKDESSINKGSSGGDSMDDSEGKERRSVGVLMMSIPVRFFVFLGVSLLIVLGAAALTKMRGDQKSLGLDVKAATLEEPVITLPDALLVADHARQPPSLLGTKPAPSTAQMSYTERLNHPAVVQLQNCTVSFTAPSNMEFLPIWMPSYPASGAASASKKGDILKPIIDKLTGWTTGSKNYHMSIRNKLKRCHATNTPTAVCTNGHPLTSIGPDKQTKNFHSKVIMVLRNFLTAHPAMMQDKAFAYHGAKNKYPRKNGRLLETNGPKQALRLGRVLSPNGRI